MLRSFFIWLSHNKFFRRLTTSLGFARKAARRFVAGETLAEAIQAIRSLNANGILATIDHLGENVTTQDEARKAAQDYIDALDCFGQTGVKSHASLKLTQLGLDLGDEFCRDNVARVVRKAKDVGAFIRIDMESSDYTDRTLAILRSLRAEFDNVGIVIQAYLYRTQDDIAALCKEGANVRLCKGAYKEPADKAFPKKADVDANFVVMAHMLLSEDARQRGAYGAFATHDVKMIEAVKAYVAEHNVPRDQFEFQMLYGIRRDLQQQLAKEGYTMRVYVPYGTEWYPYFMRRLAERPANIWFMLSNLFRG
jgi:proline dehydrogenase